MCFDGSTAVGADGPELKNNVLLEGELLSKINQLLCAPRPPPPLKGGSRYYKYRELSDPHSSTVGGAKVSSLSGCHLPVKKKSSTDQKGALSNLFGHIGCMCPIDIIEEHVSMSCWMWCLKVSKPKTVTSTPGQAQCLVRFECLKVFCSTKMCTLVG